MVLRDSRPRPLVQIIGLSKSYEQRRWISRTHFQVPALDNVDLEIPRGRTVALVGESGSGKSTLALCLVRLETADRGQVWFGGHDLLRLTRGELLPFRRQMQLILQDSATAFNPRFTAAEIIEEPLLIQGWGSKPDRRQRALALMEHVQLLPRWASRRPSEFSGGQRQRLAIARALAVEPKFLILDEAFSGLDLSIQAQIANLLIELQQAGSLTYLLISHDLGLAAQLADEVAVMLQGKIVERGAATDVFRNPGHQHTRALLDSLPVLEPVSGSGSRLGTP